MFVVSYGVPPVRVSTGTVVTRTASVAVTGYGGTNAKSVSRMPACDIGVWLFLFRMNSPVRKRDRPHCVRPSIRNAHDAGIVTLSSRAAR